ncbi:cellulase family glycosylhydrolase [Sphaerisporangium sp. B11E5]|uniref:cellulase family glycosylhydrolase n=1 Tax=Sphaerisporangium sp. B11E5 TaxID=3153563 RepID=UPI00325E346C
MRRRSRPAQVTLLSLLAALLGAMLVAAPPASAAVGLRVSGTNLTEANGSNFVIRGVSHAHVWYQDRLNASLAGIKSLGANAVRVVLSGGRWTPANNASDVANVVAQCKANKLICVLENHDTTGYGEQGGAVTLDAAVNYWISVQSALTGQEDYVIVNIGNEPIGNNAVTPGWTQATTSAITRLRNAGFQHMLMVDAPNWGQDWQFTMRDNARSVFNADPQRNTVFSIHMYGVFDTAAEINAYLDAFRTAQLPLVIGEFGHNHSDGNPDEDTIMAQAQSRGLGYIGWSWSGNSSDVAYLDMTNNFDASSLTSWGTRIFNGANGIRTTSREATIYGGSGTDTTPPSTPGTPTASNVSTTGATLTWTASTDTGGSGLAGYNVYQDGGTLLGQSTTNSITLTGLTPGLQYRVYVRARDGAGNLSGNSSTVIFTTTGGGNGGGCTATATAQSQWGNGYVMQVVVTNTRTTTITGWTVTATLPSGHTVTGSWNAGVTTSGSALTARNAGYNGTVAAGQTASFGFQGGRPDGSTTLPSGFTCTAS